MTRINTNVSSLVGRNNLQRANADLSQSLTRLSTGLRINTGADDPAGLIASENLRSDITSIRRAISNTDRANQVIATADSALGQVSSLLNDIRGLVTESANSGALSDEQIAANQLQVDSSLEALNRIAQTTTFQGRRLLDGSLDFLTTAGTNASNISNLQIDQANLGATGSVSVDVEVTTAATQAQVDIASIPAAGDPAVTASAGSIAIDTAEAQGTATIAVDTGSASGFDVTALTGGAAAGAEFDGAISITITDGSSEGVVYDDTTNTLAVTVDITGGNNTTADLASVINASTDFSTASVTGGTETIAASNTGSGTASGGVDAGTDTINITPDAAGDFNRTISLVRSGSDLGAGVVNVVEDAGAGTITVTVDDDSDVTIADIVTALNSNTTGFTAAADAGNDGDGVLGSAETVGSATIVNVGATTAGADATTGGLTAALTFELAGADGSEVLSFGVGTSITQLKAGIDLVSDATGVSSTINGTTLELTSTAYGSDAFVDLSAITDTAGLITDARNTGTDIVASVNGVAANGSGNDLSINTATLDLSATLATGFTGTASFTIGGGGALFQLGPDVVSNQQARLGIGSVNTARLGGATGKLFQLGSGGSFDLSTDATSAAKIVEEAIDQVTSLRGRLGAFQRTSLETNKNALNDTLTNLTEAESSIRDADFAEETASLTRSQILVQSGTRVLAIANQNPQNVLALLN